MHAGRASESQLYSFRNTQLNQTIAKKDIGVLADSELKLREQAAAAVLNLKATAMLSVIRRSSQTVDLETLPALFKTPVKPHLEYCNTIWGPFNRADQQ